MIRDIRAGDAVAYSGLLKRNFPEEEAILGSRPEEIEKLFHRLFRWDFRLVLGLMGLVGRRPFRMVTVEENGQLAAATLLSYEGGSAYVSSVMVDVPYRRKGYAKMMLEACLETAKRRGKSHLVLDVLATNTPARTLYDSIGYRPLREATFLVHNAPHSFLEDPAPALAGVRPFRPADARALAAIAAAQKPPAVESILPTSPRQFSVPALVRRTIGVVSEAWVLEEDGRPVAFVRASAPTITEAGNLSAPVIGPSVDPERARALVDYACRWLAEQHAVRIMSWIPEENGPGRAAITAAGFQEAFHATTLYRPTGR